MTQTPTQNEARRKYAHAVFEEQRARCIALAPEGHWTLTGGFSVRPMTARDLAILDEICPPVVRGGKMSVKDYAVLLWHMAYPKREYRWRWMERCAMNMHGQRVALWLTASDELAADVHNWMDMQCQDLGGGGGDSDAPRKEFASAAVVLATRAAGDGNPLPLLDVPLITLGQILKIRDAVDGVPIGNRSDALLTPEVLMGDPSK